MTSNPSASHTSTTQRPRRALRGLSLASCLVLLGGCMQPESAAVADDDAGARSAIEHGAHAAAREPSDSLPVSAVMQTQLDVEAANVADRGLRSALLRARQAEATDEFFVKKSAGALIARNEANEFLARYEAGRVLVRHEPADASAAAWDMELSLSGIGRGGVRALPELASVRSAGARVEHHREGLVEWYDNGPLGLEQGFTLEAPPAGEGRVEIAIELAGELSPVSTQGGDAVELHDAEGRAVLRVSELYARDATGRVLPAEMELHDDQLLLLVGDDGAEYPIDVDPLVAQLQTSVIGSDSAVGDVFGWAVAVDNATAVVGAPTHQDGAGAAYVFVRSSGAWTQQAKLTRQFNGTQPSDPSQWFGYSVAISGNTIAVGAPHTRDKTQGRTHVFTRSGSTWTLQQVLDGPSGGYADDDDLFGSAVALEGETLFVGAIHGERIVQVNPDVAQLVNYGQVYLYTRASGVWTSRGALAQSELGLDVGRSLALQAPTLLVGASEKVYAYNRSSTTVWDEAQVLKSPSPTTNGGFGAQVAIAGVTSTTTGTALIGEPGANTSRGTRSGGARVFVRSNSTSWTHQTQLVPTTCATDTAYGSVTLAVNSPSGRMVAAVAGAAQSSPIAVFSRSGSTWTQQSTIPGADPDSPMFGFGYSLDMDADTLVVGFPFAPFIGGMAGLYRVGAANGDSCTSASQCASGFCVDGVCCDSSCSGGTSDCRACSRAAGAAQNGVCSLLPSTRTCRASAGVCDVAETCTGSSASCPSNRLRSSTYVCRASAGACDIAETCSGSSTSCPANALRSSTHVCRAAAGACDVAETCSGSSTSCPADALQPADTICRNTNRLCDPYEVCSGTEVSCPADTLNFCF